MSNKLYTKGSAPVDIEAVDIYQVLLARSALKDTGTFEFSTGTLSGTSTVTGSIVPTMQPSNSVTGKKLSVELHSSNLGAGPNTVTINGTTFSGAVTETLTFVLEGVQTSTEFWRTVTSVAISITASNSSYPAGALQVLEAFPMNRAENTGDYSEIEYDNGIFSFFQAGTAFEQVLQTGHYLVDYPAPISIPLNQNGALTIGADINGENFAQCILEAPQFFNANLTDVRIGETASALTHTSLHALPRSPTATDQTTMLLDLDGTVKAIHENYIAFSGTHQTDIESVNSSFGESLVVDRPFRISNSAEIIGPKEGTIEFFLSPLHDTWESDGRNRQIFDITNLSELEITSTTATTILLPFKIRSILKIYLAGDIEKKDLSGQYSLQKDNQTVVLPAGLNKQRTAVVVQYIPASSSGDRMEMWIDGYTMLSFSVLAGGSQMTISRPVKWKRNTWHRIMCSWDIGNTDNNDRIRLFVDGVEDSAMVWGGGSIWGDGSVWGQSLGAGTGATLSDLPAFEVFGEAVFGANFAGDYLYPFRMDNCRFSSVARTPTRIGSRDYDLAWNDNVASMSPVIADAVTKAIYDFDTDERLTVNLANLLYRDTPLYSIGIEIDDGFAKLSNPRVRQALLNIYQRTKPAHMRLYASIKQEQ